MNDSFSRFLVILLTIVVCLWGLNYLTRDRDNTSRATAHHARANSSARNVSSPSTPIKTLTAPSGLKSIIMKAGKGASPKKGQRVRVHYTGWLHIGTNPDGSPKKGKKFDSSRDRGTPFRFTLGLGRVIKGWDLGVAQMKVGGRRLLVIPSKLGYGSRGAGRAIPPNANLVFDVELLGIEAAN